MSELNELKVYGDIDMRIQNALIAWNAPMGDLYINHPTKYVTGVKVVEKMSPFPRGWSEGYSSTDGACWVEWRKMDDREAVQNILMMFRRLVLDGIPALVVHRAFFKIDGYRYAGGWHMSPDGDQFNP